MYTQGGQMKRGFTAIELVIVILIAGALVGLSVLFYGNVQTRAFNTKTEDSVSRWMVALEAYQDMNQKKVAALLTSEAATRAAPTSLAQGSVCLGALEDYPSVAHFPEGRCDTELEAVANESLMRELGASARTIEQHYDEHTVVNVTDTRKVRGIRLEYSGQTDILTIVYNLRGNRSCSVPGAQKINLQELHGARWRGNTECRVKVTSEVADKS